MIQTDKTTQSIIIRFYKAELEKRNVTIVTATGPQLRIAYDGNFTELLNSIHPCEIQPSTTNISGKYTTFELEIKTNLFDSKNVAKSGSKIYLVIAVQKSGSIRPKQLTPDSIGVGGKNIKKNVFEDTIHRHLDQTQKKKISEIHMRFLHELLEISKHSSPKFKTDLIDSISPQDLNTIAKDFGEITGAIWYMYNHNKDAIQIQYPALSNAALVDYICIVKTAAGIQEVKISAKANEGAPPSINAIAEILEGVQYSDKKKDAAKNAIISISQRSTVDGIVEAQKELQTPGYIWLKKNLFKNKDFQAADCEKVLSNYSSAEEVLDVLDPFYKLIKKSASKMIADRLFATRDKKYGLIISPLGYQLVDILNTDKDLVWVLNNAATSINVSQLYMKINASTKTVDYFVKEFKSSTFKFDYNANAGKPSLKKIQFKLDKRK